MYKNFNDILKGATMDTEQNKQQLLLFSIEKATLSVEKTYRNHDTTSDSLMNSLVDLTTLIIRNGTDYIELIAINNPNIPKFTTGLTGCSYETIEENSIEEANEYIKNHIQEPRWNDFKKQYLAKQSNNNENYKELVNKSPFLDSSGVSGISFGRILCDDLFEAYKQHENLFNLMGIEEYIRIWNATFTMLSMVINYLIALNVRNTQDIIANFKKPLEQAFYGSPILIQRLPSLIAEACSKDNLKLALKLVKQNPILAKTLIDKNPNFTDSITDLCCEKKNIKLAILLVINYPEHTLNNIKKKNNELFYAIIDYCCVHNNTRLAIALLQNIDSDDQKILLQKKPEFATPFVNKNDDLKSKRKTTNRWFMTPSFSMFGGLIGFFTSTLVTYAFMTLSSKILGQALLATALPTISSFAGGSFLGGIFAIALSNPILLLIATITLATIFGISGYKKGLIKDSVNTVIPKNNKETSSDSNHKNLFDSIESLSSEEGLSSEESLSSGTNSPNLYNSPEEEPLLDKGTTPRNS